MDTSIINLPCWNVNNLSMQTGLCSWGLDSRAVGKVRSITGPPKKRHGAMAASFNHGVPVESWTVGGGGLDSTLIFPSPHRRLRNP